MWEPGPRNKWVYKSEFKPACPCGSRRLSWKPIRLGDGVASAELQEPTETKTLETSLPRPRLLPLAKTWRPKNPGSLRRCHFSPIAAITLDGHF